MRRRNANLQGVRTCIGLGSLIVCLFSAIPTDAGQTGRNDPLAGDGINPVLYYYDYSDDGTTTGQLIHDKTDNTFDTDDEAWTRDDLVTSNVREGNPENNPFVFADGSGLDFMLPGARVWDVDATGNGGLTATQDVLDHQRISDAGGFTFETYMKRTTETAGVHAQHIWNPEGMHSIEILIGGHMQFALRGLGSFLINRNTLNSSVMPIGEWHHIMAVMTVEQPLPEGGDPGSSVTQGDPLLVHYELFIDGVSYNAGTTMEGVPINPVPPGGEADLNNGAISPGLTLNSSINPEHGVGWNEFGAPEGTQTHFRGQLALTRVSLGALTVEQSLFDTGDVPGDYNGDGKVSAADFTVWRDNLGATGTPGSVEGDGTGNNLLGVPDGDVDQFDFDFWKDNYGTGFGSGAGGAIAASSVPEPSAAGLLCLAGGLIFRRSARIARFRIGRC